MDIRTFACKTVAKAFMKGHVLKILVLLTCLTATPMLADCPTGADLATGIRVTETDGTTHVYTGLNNGIAQVDITYTDGAQSRNLLAQGTHVLRLAEVENGAIVVSSISATTYPLPATDLPIPTAGSVWTVDTTVLSLDETYAETQSQRWGDTFELTIGSCIYDAIGGALVYSTELSSFTEGVYFIEDLGIGLLYVYDHMEADGPAEVFSYINIEAVK